MNKKIYPNCIHREKTGRRGLFRLLLFAVCTLLATPLYSQSYTKQIALNLNNVTLVEALKEINRLSGNIINYKVEEVNSITKRVTIAEPLTVQKAVEKSIEGTTLTYRVQNDNLLIVPESARNRYNSVARTVKGHVADEKGDPMVGATVVIKGTAIGVVTDVSGNYSINVPAMDNPVLLFSFIGTTPREVRLTNQTTVNVTLTTDTKSIDEVVIVGAYGTLQKRSDMVGSAFQINEDKLRTLPAARIDQMLEGLIPGLSIEPNTDQAVARTRNNMRVRGTTSLSASSEPLWIVDGVPIYTGDRTNQVTGMSYSVSPLSFIDPADIASITVLKDATETTIYGANGSNGIILVTTKSGMKGKPTIEVNLKAGFGVIDNSTKYKILDSKQWMMLAKEAWVNAGNNIREFPYQDSDMNSYSTTDTDWYKAFYGIGRNKQVNVSISGGNENIANFLSLNYFNEQTIVKGNNQDRFSARLNSAYKVSKRLSAEFRLVASYNINDLFSPGRDYYENLPIVSPYNSDGSMRLKNKLYETIQLSVGDIDPWTNLPVSSATTIIWPKEYNYFNSIAERQENVNIQKTFNTIGRIALKYEIMNSLTFVSEFGVDYNGMSERMYYARSNMSGMTSARNKQSIDPEQKIVQTPVGYARRGQSNFLYLTNSERINYVGFFGKHTVSAMAAFELTDKRNDMLSSLGNGFPNDKMQEVSYAETSTGSGSSSIERTMSYFAQGKYSYDNRYFATINFRSDGNSDFGEAKWTNFYSGGVSWNIHNEKFFDVDFIHQLKLRVSYGTAGNSRIGSAISYGSYKTNITNGYDGGVGSTISDIASPGLTWETTWKFNAGLDIGIMKRLNVSLEVYGHNTLDMLSPLYVSRVIGQSKVYRNVGSMRNIGVELAVDLDIISNDDLQWSVDVNASHNRNKILSLYGENMVSFGNTAWIKGYDKDIHMVVRWAGIDPRDGHPLWYDKNGNITREYSYDNRVPYKTSRPTVFGGFGSSITWKNLSLTAKFIYSVGGYVNSSFAGSGITDGYAILDRNQSVEALDRWRYPGDLAPNAINIYKNPLQSTLYNSRYLYNKTFLSLSNLAIIYNVPQRISDKLGLGSASITLIGDNLGIWTPYDYSNRNSYKTLRSGDPVQRNFSVSVALSF